MTTDEISFYNEHLKIIQRRVQYLRGQARDKGFAQAELDALLWLTEDVLPYWVKAKARS